MRGMKELLSAVGADLRYALRGLRKRPGFAAAVVLTLGLGIGANTAIFTVVDHLLIRDLPFEKPDELYVIQALRPQGFRVPEIPLDVARTLDDADIGPVFRSGRMSMVRDDGASPTTITVVAIEPGLSAFLGLPPAVGRPFNPDDAVPGTGHRVILSYGYWVGTFGQDPEIVGRTIVLDSIPVVVAGVMSPEFRYPLFGTTHVYSPLASDGTSLGRTLDRLAVLTRTDPETVERTQAVGDAFLAALPMERGESDSWSLFWAPLNEPRVNPDVRRALYLTLGAVTLMLLVALVNGVNLMLVRGAGRAREIGVRLALGGSRRRVVAQMLAESLVLALVSGVVALTLALVGVEALWSMAPAELSRFGAQDVSVDTRILFFVALLATGSGLGFGLLPAVRAVSAGDSTSGARLSSHSASDRRRTGSRDLLVVIQVAASLTLLFGAGLLGRSFSALIRQDPGMEPQGLVTMNIQLSRGRYPDAEGRAAFLRSVTERIAAIPGVSSLTVGGFGLPSSGVAFAEGLHIEGEATPVTEATLILPYASGDRTLLATLGTRLIAGRNFSVDDEVADRRLLVTESFAKRLGVRSPSDAVGLRFTLGEGTAIREAIGVIEDARLEGMDPVFGKEAFFTLYDQDAPGSNLGFLVRTTGPFEPIRKAMASAVREVDPGQPIAGFLPVEDLLHDSVSKPRFFLTLMAIFAVCALLLAAIGLYGVLSYSVSQRMREMGIRVALGAAASDVRLMVLRHGLALALVGSLVGAATALAASRVMESLLFETSPTDILVLLATATVLLSAALIASYLPARRATRVNPVEVLRAE